MDIKRQRSFFHTNSSLGIPRPGSELERVAEHTRLEFHLCLAFHDGATEVPQPGLSEGRVAVLVL